MSAPAFALMPKAIAKPGEDLITALPTELIREIINNLSWNETLTLTSTSNEYRRYYLDKILQRAFIPYGSLEGIPIIFNENIVTELILQPINSGHIMSTSSITKSLLDRRMPLSKLTRLTDLHIISDRALRRAPLTKKHEWQQLESLLPPHALIHCLVSPTGLPPETVAKHWVLGIPKPLNLDTQYLTNLEQYHGYALSHIWKCTKLTSLRCRKFPADLRNKNGELEFNSFSTLTNLRVLELEYQKKKFPLSIHAFRDLTKLNNLVTITVNIRTFEDVMETIPPFIFKQPKLRTLNIMQVDISPSVLPEMEGVSWSFFSQSKTLEPKSTVNQPRTLPNLGSKPQLPPLPTERPYWVPDKDCAACTRCGAEFTVTLRRHHCRNCGKIFCGHCCSRKLPLNHLSYQTPQLTCNDCYLNLYDRVMALSDSLPN